MVNSQLNKNWLIIAVFAIVLGLELSTPPAYVFGYLYSGAILLPGCRRSQRITLIVTLLACFLTLLNLIFPGIKPFDTATFANRVIVVLALLVTGWLSQRNRHYEETVAKQQAQLQSQEQMSQMREDFISTLTHDLKTPILGAIETIKSYQQELFGEVTPTQKKVLGMMARSQETSLKLVETLLDVYRNDSEGLQLHQVPINLVTLAEEQIANLTETTRSRRVYIRLRYGESDFRRSLWVNGDELQLQRVFTNLLTNSINHSPRGGKVEISLESQSSCHIVKVIDEGPGITEDELPHLFERFYQGHSNRQAKGAGLGLYLSRQIVEAHSGIIWAEKRFPQGAQFVFKLPAIPGPNP